jgi:hypothetical protein
VITWIRNPPSEEKVIPFYENKAGAFNVPFLHNIHTRKHHQR